MPEIYQQPRILSRTFVLIGGKTREKGKIEAGGRAIFSTKTPECINCAQYISYICYMKDNKEKCRPIGLHFNLFLIFGRDKIEIRVQIEV
jgi:hypothetical protein